MADTTVHQVAAGRAPKFRRYAVQITPVMRRDPATGRTVFIHAENWSLTGRRYFTRRRAIHTARLFHVSPPTSDGTYYTGRAVELVPAHPNSA